MAENTDISRINIRFSISNLGDAEGELARFLAPRSIDAILRKLPFEGRLTLLKEEVYFEIPVKLGLEKPKSKVDFVLFEFTTIVNLLSLRILVELVSL